MRQLFDRLPVGVMIYRLEELIYANGTFLQAVGYDNLDELIEAGGLDGLLVAPDSNSIEAAPGKPCALTIVDRGGESRVDVELIPVLWESEAAHALLIRSPAGATEAKAAGQPPDRDEIAAAKLAATQAQSETAQAHILAAQAEADAAQAHADAAGARAEIAELHAILDTATDGVIVLDRAGTILSANRSAEALFGYDARELAGRPFLELFAPESVDLAATYLDSVYEHGVVSMLNNGRDVIGRMRQGGHAPLFMSLGRIGEDAGKLCAVFRDVTPWKRVEADLLAAKRQAEKASSAKSELLAKISHEIRTPLNAIIGFSEVMMEERLGPVANERYRDYVKDIHAAGGHLISLINDLLDLSKIEAGKLELTLDKVSLNDLAQQCVALMQPQANRQRIIIRTSLPPDLPQVVADARSLRQIMLNLLSNSIKFTEAGGQVIVSTALSDDGNVALRVRDSGIGMSEAEIATALEPFRQIETTIAGRAGGTGLGLPLTKALAEANRARFRIRSTPKKGTLVEIVFQAAEALAG
jgi:PAS domain S-box-containing protein